MLKNKKGFSLIEILLTLGVIAGISIAAFLIYNKVQTEFQLKEQIQEFSIINGITSQYLNDPRYMVNYDNKDQQIKFEDFKGLIPDEYVKSWSSKGFVGSGSLKVFLNSDIRSISATIARCSNLSQCNVGFNYLEISINWGNKPANKNYGICKRLTDSQIKGFNAFVHSDNDCNSGSTSTTISYLPESFKDK